MMCACVCMCTRVRKGYAWVNARVCVRLCPINGFNVAENEIYYEFSPFE